jgi:ribosomal protein S18 acetylase RimI-like enzyme
VKSARSYDEEVETESGERIHVRAIRPSDKEGLLHLFKALSPRSVYSRFLYPKKDVSPEQLAYFTELDFKSHVALVVTVGPNKEQEIVGVGRYILDDADGGPKSAEVALAVADEHQNRGIGHALLTRLAELGKSQGVERFEAIVHKNDEALLHLFEHSGFEVDERTEFARVHVALYLSGSGAHT